MQQEREDNKSSPSCWVEQQTGDRPSNRARTLAAALSLSLSLVLSASMGQRTPRRRAAGTLGDRGTELRRDSRTHTR